MITLEVNSYTHRHTQRQTLLDPCPHKHKITYTCMLTQVIVPTVSL